MVKYKQGSTICRKGDPMSQILFITNGSVKATFGTRSFLYRQGDVIGICDLSVGIHSCTYAAASDVTLFSYPYKNLSSLETLLREKPEIASLLVHSMCSQIANLLQYKIVLKRKAENAYELSKDLYPQYERLCTLYALAPKKLASLSEVKPFSELDVIDEWLFAYYREMTDLDYAALKVFFNHKPGIALGFVRKGADDAFQIMQLCGDYWDYLEDISQVFLNHEGHDLFGIISELHLNSLNMKGADDAVETLVTRLTGLVSDMPGIESASYQKRLDSYQETLAAQRASQVITEIATSSGAKQNLADSLDIILQYSGLPMELCNKFIRNVQKYTKLADRGSSDDDAHRLRRELTADFYEIYKQVLMKSLVDPVPPTIIKMFLDFGYVDATLAGHENADYLYSIADSLKGDPRIGVYTIREWLTAIYKGQKEPSRNDLDEDYTAYLRRLKMTRQIDSKEEIHLLADTEKKLRFEMENAFPIVNKITNGIISTFCPLFSDRSIQRKLEDSLLTPALLKETIDGVRRIDFSAYFREVMYSSPELGNAKEVVHVEILPDIVLMPNVGMRGVMWQEVEGMKRTTSALMFFPMFMQNDLKPQFIRLTGEFRWEMCKRVQGARWNDLSEPSLTSEYVDYLQFYKHNRELSSDVKETLKKELVRSRNNYRAVFASNYADWIMNEANGSSRLNKYVRKLLFAYCPFSAEIRGKLNQNPQFSELLSRYHTKQQQRERLLSRLMQKITQGGKTVPQELYDELEYVKR